jgi:hypothetical protein
MNQQDIDWFKAALSHVCDMLADITAKKEDLENAADPDGRGGIGYSWAGRHFDEGYDLVRKALGEARKLQPIITEDLDQ